MLEAPSLICGSPKMMIMTLPSRGIEGKKFEFQEYSKDLMNKLQNICLGSMIENTFCSISIDICESLTKWIGGGCIRHDVKTSKQLRNNKGRNAKRKWVTKRHGSVNGLTHGKKRFCRFIAERWCQRGVEIRGNS